MCPHGIEAGGEPLTVEEEAALGIPPPPHTTSHRESIRKAVIESQRPPRPTFAHVAMTPVTP